MRKLVIVTDLGQLRAYLIRQEFDDPSPTIDLVRDADFLSRHHRFADRDTDQAGQFPAGAAAMACGMPHGEQHDEIQEVARARIRQVAAAVSELAGSEPEAGIYFAAPKPVHRQLVSQLGDAVQKRISKSLQLDLVKVPKLDLLRRFELA